MLLELQEIFATGLTTALFEFGSLVIASVYVGVSLAITHTKYFLEPASVSQIG
jgi:hypothetical protein